MIPASQPRLTVISFEGDFTEIETDEFTGVLTISNSMIPELIDHLQVITHTSPRAAICDRCKTDQEPFCIGCDLLQPHDTVISAQVKGDVLQKLADPMKALLLAIGKTYDESMKLPVDYHSELGESIQVCFYKYKELREAIEESLRTEAQS